MPDIEKLKVHASKFRAAILKCERKQLPISFRLFPLGSCGDTSLLLGKYFQEIGLGTFDYVCGIRYDDQGRDASHAWLQAGDIIIDITADQFNDINQPVIVTKHHTWYLQFKEEDRFPADYEIYDDRTKALLIAAYKYICSLLD